jgi:hypothetical protein
MKRSFYLIFVLLFGCWVAARNYKLIASGHFADNSKDCRKIGNCISAKSLSHDTLKVTIFTDNHDQDLNAFRDSFTPDHDTLSLNQLNTAITTIYVFNTEKNKTDTLETVQMTFLNRMDDSYDTRRNEYTLTGFDRVPIAVQFNHSRLCDCPTLPVQFEIFNNDTINMINANGHKHGVWISFYETGEIKEKKFFDKGRFTGGQMFDKNGEDEHAIYQGENHTMIFVR